MEKFAERLKEERQKKNMTQAKLAEIAGVSTQTISSYEKGGKSPNLDNAAAIAKALGVSLDYLAGGADETEVKMQFKNLADVVVAINNLKASLHGTSNRRPIRVTRPLVIGRPRP